MMRPDHIAFAAWSACLASVDPVYDSGKPWLRAVGSRCFEIQRDVFHLPDCIGFFSSGPSTRQGAEACFFLYLIWMWSTTWFLTWWFRDGDDDTLQNLRTVCVLAVPTMWIASILVCSLDGWLLSLWSTEDLADTSVYTGAYMAKWQYQFHLMVRRSAFLVEATP